MERPADAVRFSVLRDRDGQIAIGYVAELNYLPREHGSLQYDSLLKRWLSLHPEERVQALAECFLQSYLEKRSQASGVGSQENPVSPCLVPRP